MTTSNGTRKEYRLFDPLLKIIFLPILFIMFALRCPIITLEFIPNLEHLPGGHLVSKSIILLPSNQYLHSHFELNIPYILLWILVGIVLVQLIFLSSRLHLVFDIGFNLLINAGILWLWNVLLFPTFVVLMEGMPEIIIYTPLLGMILVPFQRILIHDYRKKKSDSAP